MNRSERLWHKTSSLAIKYNMTGYLLGYMSVEIPRFVPEETLEEWFEEIKSRGLRNEKIKKEVNE